MYLYGNTATGKTDWRELFKIAFPVLSLFILSNFNNSYKIFFFKALYLILGIHIIAAFLWQLYFYGNAFEVTSDHRYFLPLLGRGPGDIAIAFYVLFVGAVFYLKISLFNQDTRDKILLLSILLDFLFSILAQSRTWPLISVLFILLSYKSVGYRVLILKQSKLSIFLLATFIVAALQVNFFGEIYKRTNYSLLSGRTDLWLIYIQNIDGFKFFKTTDGLAVGAKVESTASTPSKSTEGNSMTNNPAKDSVIFGALFGKNLERKLLIDKASAIETSDAHNVFFDLSQSYGLMGCIFLIFSYFLSLRNLFSMSSLAPVGCFLVVGLVMSPFKVPYLFYTNVLLLLIPMISWPSTGNVKSDNSLGI
jgi:hypothetical protein